MSVPEFRVFMMLSAVPHATVTDMAEALNVSRFTAHAMLDSLRRNGFLEPNRTPKGAPHVPVC